MNKLFAEATKRAALRRAWSTVRGNGLRSPLPETRAAIEQFDREAETNIARIQTRLRNGTFSFEPQKGVAKRKHGKGARGIVMAPVHNRIVERAWLDALQAHVPLVRDVINTRTSIGGVSERSVPHGLLLIRDAMSDGKNYFVRADISGFFDHIPRTQVIDCLAGEIDDPQFLDVLYRATLVTLENEQSLGEDRRLFPTDETGVAQGSPLSPLLGNILLREFDDQFNSRGILCVRFIDDFVLMGPDQSNLRKAFDQARAHLSGMGLECHDPFEEDTAPDKADAGHVKEGFVFLGYDIRPGLLQPSRKARNNLLDKVDRTVQSGRKAVSRVMAAENGLVARQRYVQTLDLVDRIIRGWGESFAYSNDKNTLDHLDAQVDRKIKRFRTWYQRRVRDADWRTRRRTGGVCLLNDVEHKSLDELPFRLGKNRRRRSTKEMIVVSTDGSAETDGSRAGRDKGPGGWAAVFHADGTELAGGAENATNNEMELTAVVKALEATPVGTRVRICTDSQYVYRAVQEGTMIRSNPDLWHSYREAAANRRVDIVWVRAHAGDKYNERADTLAREQVTKLLATG